MLRPHRCEEFPDFLLGRLPARDVDFCTHDFHHLGCDYRARASADFQRHAEGMCIEESGGISVSGARGVHGGCRISFDEVPLIPCLDPAAVLAHLHDRYAAEFGDFIQSLDRVGELGESLGLGLVREDYIYIFFHDVVQEGQVGLHHVV